SCCSTMSVALLSADSESARTSTGRIGNDISGSHWAANETARAALSPTAMTTTGRTRCSIRHQLALGTTQVLPASVSEDLSAEDRRPLPPGQHQSIQTHH